MAEKMNMMKVLVVEPGNHPYMKEIEGTLESEQEIVGGFIEVIYPFSEEVALVCNEEGKMNGLPLNRGLYDEDGKLYDIVAGTFFVCGLGEDGFCSLSDELAERFEREFHHPELFVRLNGVIQAIPTDI